MPLIVPPDSSLLNDLRRDDDAWKKLYQQEWTRPPLPDLTAELPNIKHLPRDQARLVLHNLYRRYFHLSRYGRLDGYHQDVTSIPKSRTDLIKMYDDILDGHRKMFPTPQR